MDEDAEVLDWGNEDDEQNQDAHRAALGDDDIDVDDAVSLGDESTEEETADQRLPQDENGPQKPLSPPEAHVQPTAPDFSQLQEKDDGARQRNGSPSRIQVQQAVTTPARLTHALPPKPPVADMLMGPATAKATSMKTSARGISKRANGTPPPSGRAPPATDYGLPPHWETRQSGKGEQYFYNTRTHQSTWSRPSNSISEDPPTTLPQGDGRAGPSNPAPSKRVRPPATDKRPANLLSQDDRYYRPGEGENPLKLHEPRAHRREEVLPMYPGRDLASTLGSRYPTDADSAIRGERPSRRQGRDSDDAISGSSSRREREKRGSASGSRRRPPSPESEYEDPGYPTLRDDKIAFERALLAANRVPSPERTIKAAYQLVGRTYLPQSETYIASRRRPSVSPPPSYRDPASFGDQHPNNRYDALPEPPSASKRRERASRFGPSVSVKSSGEDATAPSNATMRRERPSPAEFEPLRSARGANQRSGQRPNPTRETGRRSYERDDDRHEYDEGPRRQRDVETTRPFDSHRSASSPGTSPPYTTNQSRSEGDDNDTFEHIPHDSLLNVPRPDHRDYSAKDPELQAPIREVRETEALLRVPSGKAVPLTATGESNSSSNVSNAYAAREIKLHSRPPLQGQSDSNCMVDHLPPGSRKASRAGPVESNRRRSANVELVPNNNPRRDAGRKPNDDTHEPWDYGDHHSPAPSIGMRTGNPKPEAWDEHKNAPEFQQRPLPPAPLSKSVLSRVVPDKARDEPNARDRDLGKQDTGWRQESSRKPPPQASGLASGTNQIPLKGDRYATSKETARRAASSEGRLHESRGLNDRQESRQRLLDSLPPGKHVYERPEPVAGTDSASASASAYRSREHALSRHELQRSSRRAGSPDFDRRMPQQDYFLPQLPPDRNRFDSERVDRPYRNHYPETNGRREGGDAGANAAWEREPLLERPRDEYRPNSPPYARRDPLPPRHAGGPPSPVDWYHDTPVSRPPPPHHEQLRRVSHSPTRSRTTTVLPPMVHPLPANPMLLAKEKSGPSAETLPVPIEHHSEEQRPAKQRKSRWGSPVAAGIVPLENTKMNAGDGKVPSVSWSQASRRYQESRSGRGGADLAGNFQIDDRREEERGNGRSEDRRDGQLAVRIDARSEEEGEEQDQRGKERGDCDVEMASADPLSTRLDDSLRPPPLARGNSLLERLTGVGPESTVSEGRVQPSLRDRVSVPAKRDHGDVNAGYDGTEFPKKRKRAGGKPRRYGNGNGNGNGPR